MAKSKRRRQPPLIEGLARCVSNVGLERRIKVGAVVYIREIPNMLGHCIVLQSGRPPLVGYHIDRFEPIIDDFGEAGEQKRWMNLVGMVAPGDKHASQTIGEVVDGPSTRRRRRG